MKKKLLIISIFVFSVFLFASPKISAHGGDMMGADSDNTATNAIENQTDHRDTDFDEMMMGSGISMMGGFHVVGAFTWLLLIVFLLSGSYYFIKNSTYKTGNKK